MSEAVRPLLGVEVAPSVYSSGPVGVEMEPEIELWDESEFFDDDSLTTAHTQVADGLLEQYARSDAEQRARDELGAKVLNLITSALESPFSDAGRKMELVEQLVSRIGHLCSGDEIQKTIENHSQGNKKNLGSRADTETEEEDEAPLPRSAGIARHSGRLALKSLLKFTSLLESLRKWFMPFASKS